MTRVMHSGRRGLIVLVLVAAAVALTVVVAGVGCLRQIQFTCATSADCASSGAQGTCEANGFCSFDDSSCSGGRRYGELSGPVANQCLVAIDAGVDAPDGPPDAPPDAPVDARIDMYVHDARQCFGSGAYMMCFTEPPMGTLTLTGAIDTTTDTRCVPMPPDWATAGQPDACMLTGNAINVTGNLAVTGTRPLVLLGETITVSTGVVIDVASHRGGALAAAANATQCLPFVSDPVADVDGGGGGAGGSFMRIGGSGGRGQDANALGGVPAPADPVAPTVLRGGCAGQPGATGLAAAGAAGAGGGAIYLTANMLVLAGSINVSGAAGTGGGNYSGGSGGGSGGMIVIHATALSASGSTLVANGGGAASGGNAANGGASGLDPVVATPTVPAPGGAGAGAAGGDGFAGTTMAETGATGNNKAGGGGGGGGGYIQTNLPLFGVAASPAATLVP